ncbi:MAG: tetraacyldisaccharide 4'-kinase [Desulfuromonadaceae bacterium]|nr:tetraacyldisaccharide 4'-kinase [Desulfuromonadaceae bacterium]
MNGTLHSYWRDLASGNRTRTGDTFFLLFLTPLAWLYSSALRLRAQLFKRGVLKTYRLSRAVVSIGNITVGGTGKTPVTAYIARFLLSEGLRVAVLSRGYGGSLEGQTCVVSDGTTVMLRSEECGDEPYLLATTIPGLMVVIGPDRYTAGQMAFQQLSPDIFLLDDGFQHLRLYRNLNILLQDFTRPFGNGLTLPAGILREPASAARRADLTIFTRTPQTALVPANTGKSPHCLSRHKLADLLPLTGGTPISFTECLDKKALVFAGIADPDSFFEGLRVEGLTVVRCLNFPDHSVYNRERCAEIAEAFRESGADVLITTEKDGVKLTGLSPELASRTLLARLDLTIDNPELLKNMLIKLVQDYTA